MSGKRAKAQRRASKEDRLIEHLKDEARLDRAWSTRLAEQVHAEIGQCYANAFTAVDTLPELATTTYCEGAVISRLFPDVSEHGWIETADGTILDPTLALPDPGLQQERWGKGYFVGRRYTRFELGRLADHEGNVHLPVDEVSIAEACADAWTFLARVFAAKEAQAQRPAAKPGEQGKTLSGSAAMTMTAKMYRSRARALRRLSPPSETGPEEVRP